jgi:acyl-CoA thioesterase-1
VALALWASFGLAGCSRDSAEERNPAPLLNEELADTAPPRPRIVVLGDSLTAGLGLPPKEAFPQQLQSLLDAEGYDYEVVNAGVSGDTTAGGLRRLEWSLDRNTRVLIIALGGNDGLRGLPVDVMKQNLSTIIETARARGIAVVLTGMEAPPNFGQDYTDEFRAGFRELADKYDVAFVPFLLEGVAGNPALNQGDGIHPNARGARMVADHVWRTLAPLVAPAAQ